MREIVTLEDRNRNMSKRTLSLSLSLLLLVACDSGDSDGMTATAEVSASETSADTSSDGTGSSSGSEQGESPCEDLSEGLIPDACADWIAMQCAELSVDDCDDGLFFATSAGELGCAVAGALDEDSCQPGASSRCVAALHAGDGGPIWWYSGQEQDVFEVLCDQRVPCPAIIVGYEPCGSAGPDMCECTPSGTSG